MEWQYIHTCMPCKTSTTVHTYSNQPTKLSQQQSTPASLICQSAHATSPISKCSRIGRQAGSTIPPQNIIVIIYYIMVCVPAGTERNKTLLADALQFFAWLRLLQICSAVLAIHHKHCIYIYTHTPLSTPLTGHTRRHSPLSIWMQDGQLSQERNGRSSAHMVTI